MLYSLKSRIFFLICLILGLVASLVLYFTHSDVQQAMFNAEQRSARNVLELVELNIQSGYRNLVRHRVEAVNAHRRTLQSAAMLAQQGLDRILSAAGPSPAAKENAANSALEWLSAGVPGGGVQFIVFDDQDGIIGHAVPAMHGRNGNLLQDIKGRPLAGAVRDTISREGQASTTFYWHWTNDNEPVKKFGFFLLYPPLNWIIGAFVDIEELEREGDRKLEELLDNLRINFTNIRIAQTGVVLLFNAAGEMLIYPEGVDPILYDATHTRDSPQLLNALRAAAKSENHLPIRFTLEETTATSGSAPTREYEAFAGYFRALDWYVATIVHVEEVRAPAKAVISRLSWIMSGVFLASLSFGLVLTTRITRPLNALAEYAKLLPHKDFASPASGESEIAHLPERHKCEVGRLAAALMYMERSLRKNVHSLIESTAVNERIVGELTERKRAERELLLQTRLQELLMLISSTYISLPLERLDAEIESSLGELGRFVGADRAYLFDYDLARRISINTHEWCAPGVAPLTDHFQATPLDMAPELMAAHQGGQVFYVPEVAALDADFEFRKLLEEHGVGSVLAVPLMDADHCLGCVGFVTFCRREYSTEEIRLLQVFALMLVNVRKRGEVEKTLQLSRERAEAASLAKSQFLANMSHEIRTPLNAVLGFAHVLGRDSSLNPVQVKHVQTIIRSGEHLLRLINDILDMAKIEAGGTELVQQDFHLAKLMHELESLFRPAAKTKGLHFAAELDSCLPLAVHADQGKLRQILINLLSNAIKFTQQGQVTLRCRGRTRLGAEGSDVIDLVIEVEDSGPGIAEPELAHLFDAFYQTAKGIDAGGTGLGLAISRRYARLMGGELSVTSALGLGSRFRVEVSLLPAKKQLQPKQAAAYRVVGLESGPDGESGRENESWRILVVDDKPENLALVTALLHPVGFAVQEAADGVEALRIFEDWSPHAVLLDMRMPVMDGFETVRRIKATAQGQATFVLAITAGAFLDSRQEVMDAGVDAYLAKPFQAMELYEILGEALNLRYIFADKSPDVAPALPESTTGTLPKGHQLSRATMQAILDASLKGDIILLKRLVDEAAQEDAQAARLLDGMAEEFDYTGIRIWLETAMQESEHE